MVKKAHSLLQKWYIVIIAVLLVVTAFFIASRIPKKPELGFDRQLFNPGQFRGTIPNVFDATISRSEEQVEVVVKRENVALSFQLPIGGTKIEESENLLAFSSPNGEITTEYSMRRDGLKENIILNKVPKENIFPSTLKTEGLITKISAEGIPVFFDKNNKYQFHFERPYVKDANGAVSYAVSYRVVGQEEENASKTQEQFTTELISRLKTITQSGQSYVLQVIVDPTWLHDPKRVLPITIDPTVVHNTSSTFATGILDNAYDFGSGSSPVLSSGYQELTADPNTIGLWHMNEASGNTLDSSGNANTGTPTGTSVTAGILGNGRTFNGTSDIITTTALANSPTTETIELWIKPTAKGTIIDECDNTSCSSYNYTKLGINADNTLIGHIWNIPGTLSFGKVTFGQWYHVAMTYDGYNLNGYLDGKLIGSKFGARTAPATLYQLFGRGNAQCTGGFDSCTFFYAGMIDEVRYSRSARSAEEIKTSASRRPHATYTSPVIDLGTKATAWSGLSWVENGVSTGFGETPYNTTGLIAQWNLNERGTALTANYGGTCGANCDATLTGFSNTNGPDLVNGSGWTAQSQRWGTGAIIFDGTDDYLSIPNHSSLNVGGGPFSIEAWVKPRNIAARYTVFSTRTTNAAGGWQLEVGTGNGGTGRVSVTGLNTWIFDSADKVIEPEQWSHIVYTRASNSDTGKMYVNGKEVASIATAAYTIANNTDVKLIGAGTSLTSFFPGIIDSTRLYGRVLGNNEILSNYNSSNIEFETRVGNTADPTDGTWEAWKPTTYETPLESFDSVTDIATRVYAMNVGNVADNQTWHKKNNTIPNASDTTGTDGRIPLGSTGRADEINMHGMTVIKDGSTYKMWYAGQATPTTNLRILYATSPDGLTWTKYDNTIEGASDTTGTNGRIPLGTAGKGDSTHAGYTNVIKDGSTYKMWYSGNDGTNWRIFYATSPDGLTWTKYDNTIQAASDTTGTNGRIPLGTAGKGDVGGTLRPAVIKDGSTYKMWYSGNNGSNWRIFYATSPDGLTWTKYDNTTPATSDTVSTNGRIPLGNTGSSDSTHVYEATVMKDGPTYKMWYNNHNGNVRTGYATSPDGLTWTKYDNSVESVSDTTGTNGRIPLGNTGRGDQTHVYAPTIIKDGDVYKIWYAGHSGANYRIYHAIMSPNSIGHENDANFKTEGSYSKKITSGSNNIDASILGLWHLDETGGTGAYLHDSSPNAKHGTPTGATLAKGIKGNARSVNAGGAGVQTDYINTGITNTSSASFSTGFTAEAWAYPTAYDAVHNTIVGQENGFLLAFTPTGALANHVYSAAAWSSAVGGACTIQLKKWSHMVLTYDGTTMYVYLNGKLCGSSSKTGSMASSSLVYIGMRDPAGTKQPFHGIIDEVRISNSVRTPEEVDEAFRLGADKYVNYSISATDASLKTTFPFSVAADRPGTYLSATLGESEFANYQPDDNTVALWHLDENISEYPRSCYALRLNGITTSGVYYIDPDGMGGNAPLQVYCNMTYDGGGWTMIVKSWYGSGLIGKSAAVGAVTDATTLMGNPYKLSDQNIRNIIGTSNNYDIMVDQNGYNSLYSTGNYEYVIIRNYTAPWTYEKAVTASSTTTVFESHRASDQALAWTGNITCGYEGNSGVGGINCYGGLGVTNNPQGGAGCTINMGTASNVGWYHFFMNQYNDDTYIYICNGAQHSSGQSMNHRFWVRERYPVTAIAKDSTKNGGNAQNLITATGGTITTTANGYTVHTFTGNGTFQVTGGSGTVETLIVGGGGGGGSYVGGGGGGGGYYEGMFSASPNSYAVTVGPGGSGGSGGGAADNANGGNSSVIGGSISLTALGGGTGSRFPDGAGAAGGSGGGAGGCSAGSGAGGAAQQPTSGTGGLGFRGGNMTAVARSGNDTEGRGGGGAGAIGGDTNCSEPGDGGVGHRSSISGTNYYYAGGGGGGAFYGGDMGTTRAGNGGAGGGGGGGAYMTGTTGAGGTGGTANGETPTLNMGAAGQGIGGAGGANTGGGGGGCGHSDRGGNGGSGVVIIRYPNLNFVNNKASAVVGATSVQGKIGKARYFDGTDYISLNNPISLQTTGSQTIDMWVYPTDISARRNPYAKAFGGEGTITQETTGTLTYYYGTSGANAAPYTAFGSGAAIITNQWNHIAVVRDLTGMKVNWYINGVMTSSATAPYAAAAASTLNAFIGRGYVENYIGSIDEVRVSNVARTADEIRQAYEVGLRSHSITIDFGAKLDAGNLIANSGDLSFTIDGTSYGLNQKGSNIYPEDKIIVRENYDGTEYTAQGTVTSVNPSTGALTVLSWDAGGTFPAGGFTANADVFKWQKEYWNITASQGIHRNAVDLLTLRFTDGNEARTVWIDDLKSNGNYLTNSAGSSIISSLGDRYFQYRAIFHSSDEAVSANLTSVTLNYNANIAPAVPTLDSPVNGATAVSRTPTLQTTTTDVNIDYLRYKIELCTNLAMTTGCQTFDQTSSQAGWSGQNTETNTAYVSGMQASYTLSTPLSYNSTYYWRSYAIDPNGTNVWTSTQAAPFSFTTLAVEAASSCKMTRTNNTTNTIEWVDVSGNETGYRIQRNVNNAGWVDLDASLNPNTVSYVDNGVALNNSYQYRVASFIAGPQYSTWCTTQTQAINEGILQFGGGFSFSGITIQ